MAAPIKASLTKKKKHNLVVDVIVPKTCSTSQGFERCPKRKKNETTRTKLLHLPCDLLENILEGLSSADRIRFGATCKLNLSLVTTKHDAHRYEFRIIDKLPWLASNSGSDRFFSKNLSFMLFHPRHRHRQPHYATYDVQDLKEKIFPRSETFLQVATSRGWLLCLWDTPSGPRDDGLIYFLLFSPFNRRIIKLPDLDRKDHPQSGYEVALSSDPSSPDCVFFFLSQYNITGNYILEGKITISTLQLDQRRLKWETREFRRLISIIHSVVYYEGCFYCVDFNGQLAAYDVVQKSWEVIIGSSSAIDKLHLKVRHCYVLVCEGKLLLAFVAKQIGEYNMERVRCGLFEFSSSTRTWVQRSRLGNYAIFLGDSTAFAVPVLSSSLSGSDDTIADRMYFFASRHDSLSSPMYYSFKDGKCHACKDSEGFWSASDVKRGTWIEPFFPSEVA